MNKSISNFTFDFDGDVDVSLNRLSNELTEGHLHYLRSFFGFGS